MARQCQQRGWALACRILLSSLLCQGVPLSRLASRRLAPRRASKLLLCSASPIPLLPPSFPSHPLPPTLSVLSTASSARCGSLHLPAGSGGSPSHLVASQGAVKGEAVEVPELDSLVGAGGRQLAHVRAQQALEHIACRQGMAGLRSGGQAGPGGSQLAPTSRPGCHVSTGPAGMQVLPHRSCTALTNMFGRQGSPPHRFPPCARPQHPRAHPPPCPLPHPP